MLARSVLPITRPLLLGSIQRHCFGTYAKPMMPPPTPPPEMKWFYREVWTALQPNLDKLTPRMLSQGGSSRSCSTGADPNSVPGSSTYAGSWTQRLANVRDQGLKMAEKYRLREKLDLAFQQYCRMARVVKEFFYQKRYQQMGSLMIEGLKGLEDKVCSMREGRSLGRGVEKCPLGEKADNSGVKSGGPQEANEEKKIVIKLASKPEDKS